MKILKLFSFFILFLIFSVNHLAAQTDTNKVVSHKLYVITTNDGGEFIGTIISQDAREVLIDTKDRGQVIIPKYQIKEMHELQAGEMSAKGEYIANEVFASRYFLTTNGLPLNKGENYVQWNFWGADVEFAVAKNLGVGVMTSWFGVPVVGSVKYSIPLAKKLNLGLGILVGSGSWIFPRYGGALPYAALTFGDRRSNATLSVGYGSIFYDGDVEGRALISVAGMTKIGRKVGLMFDSFIVPPGIKQTYTSYNYQGQPYTYTRRKEGVAILVPGVRIQLRTRTALQFGFGGIIIDDEIIPAPIPFIQLFQQF